MKRLATALRLLLAGVLMALAGTPSAQQTYPNKPIRIIVPFPPGASNDILARLVGKKLTESLGVQTIVDNRPGGSTIIGASALLKSPPDGYTMMVTSGTHIITPLSSNFPLVLMFFQRYLPGAGIGTVTAAMLPYTVANAVAWTVMLLVWVSLGWPTGPGAPLFLPR